MKFRFFTSFTIVVVVVFTMLYSYNPAFTNPTGAPAGYCGSIANPNTCAFSSCHGGTATVQTGWITSTIPGTGYVPGTTYTITATAAYVGRVKFGFQISPQNRAGTRLGTMILTSSTTTQLISSSRYITHKSAGTTGTTDFHTWSFNWTAPVAGSDTVTFYGAFLCANNNGNETGDITYKSNLVVLENSSSTEIAENTRSNFQVSVYPNPASDFINVTYKIDQQGKVDIKLYDLEGRMSSVLLSEIKSPGDCESNLKLPFIPATGIYFLEISTERGKQVKRILIQQ